MEKNLVFSVACSIKHFRKSKGLSQEKLAEKSNLDRTYISGVERGVRNITLESLENIINALEITPAEFFRFASQGKNSDLPD